MLFFIANFLMVGAYCFCQLVTYIKVEIISLLGTLCDDFPDCRGNL